MQFNICVRGKKVKNIYELSLAQYIIKVLSKRNFTFSYFYIFPGRLEDQGFTAKYRNIEDDREQIQIEPQIHIYIYLDKQISRYRYRFIDKKIKFELNSDFIKINRHSLFLALLFIVLNFVLRI